MQDYNEKRNYPRMEIDCPASLEIVGEGTGGAVVKNLSGGGVLLWVERAVAPDAELIIEISPVSDITPPMRAEVRVLRCTPVDGGEGSFALACAIMQVMG